ncbi:N-formylglutamate amidohydrolase [Sphingosinicella microcystinivorans]|uniref:N-formylglutamate amidohydrolase n=1 Tax=Sphingosinicella microcystinivorans TaxID=335406 RepID=A0AAD1G1Q4_SPHMI|nr:N-formylglutamate amidohydrolase [Sphingosinicella microcystinivorans]RKS91948.1 putative N-formylglutamate amidohydrolase [Sphingosinicella microcystinivorans]BBE34934.1 N-formylglutamate amidohydrolase [Sphingosinicella microcystinivorans]
MKAAEYLPGRPGRFLIIADHASNAVPADIALGVSAADLQKHIAWDIGTAALARSLSAALAAPAVLATASRLVADCNRAPEDDGAIPPASDGIPVPGNALSADAQQVRLATWHEPYHAAIADALDLLNPRLLVSIHSFTPSLASRPQETRPWQVALLYNRDDRAARIAMRALAAEGFTVGDNQPYSGAVYGYTTDRHAEARGLCYLTFEIRQDLLADEGAIAAWTQRLGRVIGIVESELLEVIA